MADTRGFVIVNVQSGEQRVFDFPSGAFRVVQCAVNKLEHPIITRSIVYVMSDRSIKVNEPNCCEIVKIGD